MVLQKVCLHPQRVCANAQYRYKLNSTIEPHKRPPTKVNVDHSFIDKSGSRIAKRSYFIKNHHAPAYFFQLILVTACQGAVADDQNFVNSPLHFLEQLSRNNNVTPNKICQQTVALISDTFHARASERASNAGAYLPSLFPQNRHR